ncbi:MAG TPA: cyclic pyranopterin monophosphate synthase MoaC [Oscillatoriaceae cyanobacterium]
MELTHLNAEGRARMVDVTGKPTTARVAVARGAIRVAPATLQAVREGAIAKGDVLAVAQVAGVMAAKQTGAWIPMCHPLPIGGCDLRFRLNEGLSQIEIEARVSVNGPTGVEMEALTAVSAAALTIYDMVKAIDAGLVIGPIYLVRKEGGKHGVQEHFRAQVSDCRDTATLARERELQLLPEGAEATADRPAVWLNVSDLAMLQPGTCLESGTLRLEVLYARETGWLAQVNDPGTLRAGDLLEASF